MKALPSYLGIPCASPFKHHLSCSGCVCFEVPHSLPSWFYSKCITGFVALVNGIFPLLYFLENVFVIFFAWKKAFEGFGKTQVKQVSLRLTAELLRDANMLKFSKRGKYNMPDFQTYWPMGRFWEYFWLSHSTSISRNASKNKMMIFSV